MVSDGGARAWWGINKDTAFDLGPEVRRQDSTGKSSVGPETLGNPGKLSYPLAMASKFLFLTFPLSCNIFWTLFLPDLSASPFFSLLPVGLTIYLY